MKLKKMFLLCIFFLHLLFRKSDFWKACVTGERKYPRAKTDIFNMYIKSYQILTILTCPYLSTDLMLHHYIYILTVLPRVIKSFCF